MCVCVCVLVYIYIYNQRRELKFWMMLIPFDFPFMLLGKRMNPSSKLWVNSNAN